MIRNVLALAILSIACAADAHYSRAMRLHQLDTNNDQALSLSEALNARQARFLRLDIDASRSLSLAEVSAKLVARAANSSQPKSAQARLTHVGKRFAQMDVDKSGLITPNEWDARVIELFARFDADDDHVLKLEEIRNVRRERILRK